VEEYFPGKRRREERREGGRGERREREEGRGDDFCPTWCFHYFPGFAKEVHFYIKWEIQKE
jgi:hypothetical protein